MNNLEFCPKCGTKSIAFVDDKKLFCSICNFTLYHNIAGAVAVILTYENEVLLTKRNKNPQKGKLDLAGGFVDANETAEQTCQREIMEELNFKLDLSKLSYKGSLPNLYTYKDITYHTLDLFYEYPLDKKPDFEIEKEELQEVIWINKHLVSLDDFAFESQKTFWKTYIKNR